jgi:ProP effector
MSNEPQAIIAVLAEKFPNTFDEKRSRPLKIGIFRDIFKIIGGAIHKHELASAMHYYCTDIRYLQNMRQGVDRVSLQGEPSGKVTAEQERKAQATLAAMAQRQHKRQVQKRSLAEPEKRHGLADLKAAWRARQKQAAE